MTGSVSYIGHLLYGEQQQLKMYKKHRNNTAYKNNNTVKILYKAEFFNALYVSYNSVSTIDFHQKAQ